MTAEEIDALLVAVLATYSYSAEPAWSLRGALREQRLCEPSWGAGQDVQAVGNLLKAAGLPLGLRGVSALSPARSGC